MDKSLPCSSSTELEKSEVHGIATQMPSKQEVIKGSGALDTTVSDPAIENILPDFTDPSDIDKKISELQCPFTWKFPCEDHAPLVMVSATSMAEDVEDDEMFNMREFIGYVLTVYELCKLGNLDSAKDSMLFVSIYLHNLDSACEEEFFISMKKPLQHIFLSCKVHLLKAYFSDKLPSKTELYFRKALKILHTIPPCSEMTDIEMAGIYGFKAQTLSEYGFSGLKQALECAKKALLLDPNQSEWYYITGKIMGSIRRYSNWNDYVEQEELKLLERAIELHEKPSYMIFLAIAYIDCTKTIHRNLHVDREMKNRLHAMNNTAKQLYMRCIELSPNCPLVRMRCANGMLRMPVYLADKEVVKECIKIALKKLPDDPNVHHAAGMCAERLECDIEKALYHYEIGSKFAYGALADFIRLKYAYEEEYDLIGALENMLEMFDSVTSLSYIASYYLFLKRDLIKALHYYGIIMDEDLDSSTITASKPLFLNMITPVNMYPILYIEVHIKLQEKGLSNQEIIILTEFLRKLNQIDPEMSKKCADKSSRIQSILDESELLTEKYKAILQNRKEPNSFRYSSGNVRKSLTSQGSGSRYGKAVSTRRQSDSNVGSWRNVSNVESCRGASVVGSWREKDNDMETRKSRELNIESLDSVGTFHPKKQDSYNSGYNAIGYRRPRTYSNEFKRSNYDNINSGPNTKDCGRQRTYSNECERNDHDINSGPNTRDCGRQRTYSNEFKRNESPDQLCSTENRSVHKFQKTRVVLTIRDPYGPDDSGAQKSFERKRVPDEKWVKQ